MDTLRQQQFNSTCLSWRLGQGGMHKAALEKGTAWINTRTHCFRWTDMLCTGIIILWFWGLWASFLGSQCSDVASCVSMRSPTEELWRLLQKGSWCQESMAHQLLFELEEIERSLFPCPYIPTIPQRDSLQAASWNALCAPIRQHYLILHTATSKLINNQTYHGLRFWKLIPHSILPILHPLRQNHCLIKMQIASENLHVQSWRRILANLRKWPHKRNKTVARVQQHHSPNNTWHQAIRRIFWHLQFHGYAPCSLVMLTNGLRWTTLKWSSNDLQ